MHFCLMPQPTSRLETPATFCFFWYRQYVELEAFHSVTRERGSYGRGAVLTRHGARPPTLLGEWIQRVLAQEINAGIVLGAHSEPETSPWS